MVKQDPDRCKRKEAKPTQGSSKKTGSRLFSKNLNKMIHIQRRKKGTKCQSKKKKKKQLHPAKLSLRNKGKCCTFGMVFKMLLGMPVLLLIPASG